MSLQTSIDFQIMEVNSENQSAIRSVEEIAIVISASNLTPAIVNLDFLKFGGIIPKDWELAKQPIFSPSFAQINFQNGVNIVAQPRTVTIVEPINRKDLNLIQVPSIALKYVEKLPHAEYQGLSICPKSLVPLASNSNFARQYITGTLLAPGSWQQVGKFPPEAGINLIYQLEKCQFTLSINEAKLQQPNLVPMTALLFAGNFNYSFYNRESSLNLQALVQGINNWQSDLMTFREIVDQRFLKYANLTGLNREESVFPVSTL